MSFDLCVFHTDGMVDKARAMEIYHRLCEGDTTGVVPDARVQLVLEELASICPQVDDHSDEELDACPWASSFDASPGHVIVAIRWSRAAEVGILVKALAEQHRLACYDPQEDTLQLPRISR